MKANSGASPTTVFLFTKRTFFRFYSCWVLGIMKLKLTSYWTEFEHEAKRERCLGRSRGANWSWVKGYLCTSDCDVFDFCRHSHSPCKHFEKCQPLNVLWTNWNFSMISAEKGQDHWIFVITVEWISLAQALRVKAMTIVANNSSSLKELCHEIQPN